MSTYQQMEL